MDHLLNLSTAAKLVGVSRGTLQEKIKTGEMETFEGHIRMSCLCKIYPEIDKRTDAIIERVDRIRNSTVWKVNHDGKSGEHLLASQMHHLQLELKDISAELDTYKMVTQEIVERLGVIKEASGRKEKQKLQALLYWMMTQL